MHCRNALATLLSSVLALFVFVAVPASAAELPSQPGEGPGQTLLPSGLALHLGSGRLYVADTGNDRVDVFDASGSFLKSFPTGDAPKSIAVDNSASASNGDVYVVDNDGARVARYGPEGEKIEPPVGAGQFNTFNPVLVGVGPAGVIYVIDSLPAGSEFEYRLQKFDSAGAPVGPALILGKYKFYAKALAVDSTGDFYVSPGDETIQKYDEAGNLVEEIKGVFEDGIQGVVGMAVDDEDHLFAASAESGAIVSVLEFDSTGSKIRRFGYGALLFGATAIAPTPAGTGVYVSESQGPESTKGNRVLRVDVPPPGPVVFPQPCSSSPLRPASATLNAQVNPEGKATTFLFEYISAADYAANGSSFSGPKPASKSTEGALSGEKPFTLHKASAQVNLIPEVEYRCRVVAKNADGETTGKEGTFKTPLAPDITDIWTADVRAGSATLNAAVDPLGVGGTTGFFEYVDDATFKANESKFTTALKVPVGEALDFGGGEETVIRSATATGLAPGTTYHYRLVTTNELSTSDVISGVSSFRTYAPGQGGLLDNRAYELVSPAQKNSAEVAVPGPSGGVFNKEVAGRIQAAAGSGEAITYTSWTSFGEAEGAPNVSQYLSKRGAGGWGTENVSPFGFNKQPLIPPYRGFTADLGFGALVVSEPPLTPEAQVGSENLYLLGNNGGGLQALTTKEPQVVGPASFCAGYAGASADGKHAIFAGRGALAGTGAIPGEGFSLYEWSAAEGLKLVSVLPDGSAAPPSKTKSTDGVGIGTGFGAVGSSCTANQAPIRHAISEDGSVVFWTFQPAVAVTPVSPGTQTVAVGGTADGSFKLSFKGEEFETPLVSNETAVKVQAALQALPTVGPGNVEVTGSNPYTVTFKGALAGTSSLLSGAAAQQLFARIDGTETIQLDVKDADGSGPSGGGQFWAATGDGSEVFFTAPGRLVKKGAKENGLYRYDLFTDSLSYLTPKVDPEIQGVIGASEDGKYIYFVGAGVLSENENKAGQKALEGANNLYLWHEGEGIRFIAALANIDSGSWDSAPERLSARVTADGRHLAFLSVESQVLSKYLNTIAPPGEHCQPNFENKLTGDPRCAQAYLYDAEADSLTCASCNPAGSRPAGPTELPTWSNPYEGPRYLSEDGSRLFFETRDSLSSADENNRRDVYEFEAVGAGSSNSASPDFISASGGCLALISSGKSSDETYLLDAGGSGRDVFFATRSVLTGWDTNENYDVYDARVGGGFPEPPPAAIPCEGEACPAPPTGAPVPPAMLTPSFVGPPNPKPKKQKGKKKKQKSQKHKGKKGKGKKQKRAAAKGRAGR